jgi:predicted RNase H-like nuclease (RuvC/YqgF family)
LKQHLGASGPETADVEALKLEVTELRQKVEQLTEENQEMKAKVNSHINSETFCNRQTIKEMFHVKAINLHRQYCYRKECGNRWCLI